MSHTPGPWKFEESHGVSKHGSACVGFVVSEKTNVADVVASYNTSDYESLANARLIAAAPKLLRALQHFLSHVDSIRQTVEWCGSTIDEARDAVAEATLSPQNKGAF